MSNSNVPGKIFNANSSMTNYLKSVSAEQFKKDHQVIQKAHANNGMIKEAVNKLKNS